MAKLKVFGGLIMRLGAGRQVRAIVATTSQKEAARLLNMSVSEFRSYWCETYNETEIDFGLKNPGKIMTASTSMGFDFSPAA